MDQTVWKILSCLVVLGGLVGCALKDVPVRNRDWDNRGNPRGRRLSATDERQLNWSSYTAERLQDIKKLVDRALAPTLTVACAARTQGERNGEHRIEFKSCEENRGPQTVKLSGQEQFKVTTDTVELVQRELNATVNFKASRDRAAQSGSLQEVAEMQAWLIQKEDGRSTYQFTYRNVTTLALAKTSTRAGTADTPVVDEDREVNADQDGNEAQGQGTGRTNTTARVAQVQPDAESTGSETQDNETGNTRSITGDVWEVVVTGTMVLNATGQLIALDDINSTLIIRNPESKAVGGIRWLGQVEFDGACVQPKGQFRTKVLSKSLEVTSENVVTLAGERGLIDGATGQRVGRYACDKTLYLFLPSIF